MNYRELLEYTKKNPGCFWTKEQREQYSEYRFKSWLDAQDKENNAVEKEKKKNKDKESF